jgi:hypothetical protein
MHGVAIPMRTSTHIREAISPLRIRFWCRLLAPCQEAIAAIEATEAIGAIEAIEGPTDRDEAHRPGGRSPHTAVCDSLCATPFPAPFGPSRIRVHPQHLPRAHASRVACIHFSVATLMSPGRAYSTRTIVLQAMHAGSICHADTHMHCRHTSALQTRICTADTHRRRIFPAGWYCHW